MQTITLETVKEMAYNIGFRSAWNFEMKPFAANSEAMNLLNYKLCKAIVLIEEYQRGFNQALKEL